jgi:hypothetical protein
MGRVGKGEKNHGIKWGRGWGKLGISKVIPVLARSDEDKKNHKCHVLKHSHREDNKNHKLSLQAWFVFNAIPSQKQT